jgi:hypothetical protein
MSNQVERPCKLRLAQRSLAPFSSHLVPYKFSYGCRKSGAADDIEFGHSLVKSSSRGGHANDHYNQA